jgi:hypothetical protein
MHLYLELWKAKPTWTALSQEQRDAFSAGLGPAIGGLLEAGVELLGFALNDEDTEHRADYTYLALWRMPSKELAIRLERTVVEAGFHDYFEQVNARGTLISPEAAVEHMARNGIS